VGAEAGVERAGGAAAPRQLLQAQNGALMRCGRCAAAAHPPLLSHIIHTLATRRRIHQDLAQEVVCPQAGQDLLVQVGRRDSGEQFSSELG